MVWDKQDISPLDEMLEPVRLHFQRFRRYISLLQVLNVLVILFIIGNPSQQATFLLGLVVLAISALTQVTVYWFIPGTRRPYASPEE